MSKVLTRVKMGLIIHGPIVRNVVQLNLNDYTYLLVCGYGVNSQEQRYTV